MTAPATRPRRRWKTPLIAAGAVLVLFLGALWYTTTESFQAYVRRRMVSEVERITGGRAEVGSFHVIPFRLQVEVRDITVRGSEAPGEVPLAHADHLVAQMKVNSFLRTDFGFYSLSLDHPVIHVAVAPDGSTNVPALKLSLPNKKQTPVEQLFDLNIDHLALHNGTLLWADKKIPLDLAVNEAGLQMDYSFLRGRYESHISIGKVDARLFDFRPFAWMASAELSLGTTFADIKSLQWNSGHSRFSASGRVSDFRDPHLDGSYEAHFDLQEAGAIVHRAELREGAAEFKGSGHWSLEEFSSSGAMALRDLTWQHEQVDVKKVSAAADYSVTDQQIKVSKLQGKLFSGSFAGDAQVDNWLHSIPPPIANKFKKNENVASISATHPAKKGVHPKTPGVQVGAVHIRLRDVSAAETAASLNTPAHPLGRFHPAGTASGEVDATWRGSPKDTEIAFAVDVSPPAQSAAGELPITARMQGKYRVASDELELAQFSLATPSSRVQASGRLAATSTLHFSIFTSNLEEWRPLVTALGGPTDLPFQIDGNASFNGVAGGSFTSPTLAGTLVAQDFEFAVPATSRTPEQQVRWDALSASIQLSSRELTLRGGTLRRGETSADFEANAFLQKGRFTEDSPYTVHVNLHHVDVASTAALAGVDYPLTGTADVSLQISGTRAHPQVQGHIQAENAAAFGEPIEAFDADLRIAREETALENIHLTHLDALVDGSAAYTPATRGFRLDLKGRNFDLARVRQIHLDELPIDGNADFTLQGSGTVDTPVLNANVHVRDLSFDHERSGDFDVAVTTSNGELKVTGHSQFTKGTLAVDGTVGMHGDYPANITAHSDHLDLDPLWRAYLGTQLTGHSDVVGRVTMEGPLRYPRQWKLTGDASEINIELEYAKLRNDGPVHFVYEDRIAHIAPAHMVGEGTDLIGQGSIGFAGNKDLDLTAEGRTNLKLLSLFNSDITASGSVNVHMTVGGTIDQPLPQGTVQVSDGAINYAGLPSGLSEMNGSLSFTRDHMHIEQLTARTGGGTLDLRGDATRFNRQINFNLSANAKDVRLRYPPGVSSTATAELHWVGTPSSSTVSGDMLVTKLAVTPGFDFGSYLERTRQVAAITAANSPLYSVKLDVAVQTAPELQMKTAVARLSGDADLRVRGSVARPSVLGRADILEGDATFNGIKFRLERGDITFANPVAIEPQVNLQATTHVRNYDLDVTVTGTPDRLNVNYHSEPPLPKSDIIALLALGRTSQESEQLQQQSGQTMFSDEATALIINQAINQTVSSRMQKLFGVSRIKIDPQGLTTETNPTARGPQVTIEQQFANNISLTYSTNVSQTADQIIQGEYYFTRNVSVTGTRDQNGVVSFDVRIRRRKK
ncbi:MAG TPA: translocation/assembly module TamB domain-containing protein [Candidatus Solibacter sp.]|nr:translocation/assembly module TamB domain-containing protein [Candidatus Solibacter sp.]